MDLESDDMLKVTRVEVIDRNGTRFTGWFTPGASVSVQDEGRTLKVFTGYPSATEEATHRQNLADDMTRLTHNPQRPTPGIHGQSEGAHTDRYTDREIRDIIEADACSREDDDGWCRTHHAWPLSTERCGSKTELADVAKQLLTEHAALRTELTNLKQTLPRSTTPTVSSSKKQQ